MPIFSKNNKNILFVHIPKSGGSSFCSLMLKTYWQETFIIRNKEIKSLYYLKCSPQHYHREILEQIFNLEKFEKKITIVRNPFERIKSEYYWQLKTKIINKGTHPKEWFTNILLNYKSNNFIFDNHIRFQSEFITDDIKIFKLEEDGIQNALNYALDNNSAYEKLFIKILNFQKLKRTNKSKYIEEQFLKLKSQIIDFYLKDYEMFSYDF